MAEKLQTLKQADIELATEQRGSKDFSLTFIQVICAIAVVTLHTNGCFWQFSSTERYWFTANIIECVCYFAVPVFFMITGITLLDYQDRYSTKEYFKKRTEKALLPYVVWSMIGVVFLLATNRVKPETVTANWILNGLLSTDGIINLYWFFQPLFCVYLSIPLFAAIDKSKKIDTAKYLLVAGFIVNILVQFLNSVLDLGLKWPYSVSVISGYLFWTWGGYYVQNNPPTKRQKEIIFILSAIGLLLHIVGTYILSITADSIQSLYKGYCNLPCVLYTFGVFILLKDIAVKTERIRSLRKVIDAMGKYTFSVYLIHWFVLRILNDLVSINTKSIIYRLLMPYAIYAVIMGFVWCLRKVPVLRKIVP